ncbi:iron ABC transporter ATP-binding protein [Brevirhabdus pacifica]|uniref:Iron ABC transporter ATP-binding protein n=1 Tax=Brevirhabdus pacifica TaxID=1267768 RepID=A0A1U7DGP4_9RHOB|nr:ABC transporter ATP-binding protein [Brevirhabdus pacifica]APX89152.1 iron ABC transporter ATP-binding protein [Brevirhabdus pacifica]OWU76790.1 iron ABC transporter ATP-binding protein [Loktanella sp. 22II-4b]PJJ86253.1 iron complex transport system ATP-binding protein [Brevirhabdus pacifica]
MTAAAISATDLAWGPPRGPAILNGVSFALPAGRTLGVVGANGAGKSTLLRLLYRYHRPLSGMVRIGGDDLWGMTSRAAARRVAAVLQDQPTDFALTVREIARLGRVPHRNGLASAGARDGAIVEAALRRLDLGGLGQRRFGTLSGGEKQRVMVARALVQEPQVLILDEPTNHLDIRHQLEVLEMLRGLDVTVVTSLHDLNLAFDLCDEVVVLSRGEMIACGPPEAALDASTVARAFAVTASRERLEPSGRTRFTYSLAPSDRT